MLRELQSSGKGHPESPLQDVKPTKWQIGSNPLLVVFFLEVVAKHEDKWMVNGVHMGISVHLIKSLWYKRNQFTVKIIQVGRDLRSPELPEYVGEHIWGNLEKISFCRHRVVELEMLWGLNRDPNQVLSLTDVLAIGHIWKDVLHCSRLETSNLHILAGHPQPAVQQVRSGPLHDADLGLSPCVPWIIPHCPPAHYPDCLSWVLVSRAVGRAVSWQGWGRASGSVCVCVCFLWVSPENQWSPQQVSEGLDRRMR